MISLDDNSFMFGFEAYSLYTNTDIRPISDSSQKKRQAGFGRLRVPSSVNQTFSFVASHHIHAEAFLPISSVPILFA